MLFAVGCCSGSKESSAEFSESNVKQNKRVPGVLQGLGLWAIVREHLGKSMSAHRDFLTPGLSP